MYNCAGRVEFLTNIYLSIIGPNRLVRLNIFKFGKKRVGVIEFQFREAAG